ncbi:MULTISPECIES: glycosyltransferase [unclassified Leeuwenhoekiella]|uniref:glycosyltransferase family 2 protein n=1 Tax=unclassified Leeuwenhoekiella TaxID=2615029 RepID=UPI000C49E69B|nr:MULTISPECIES: glycosyltransferase [unclassified Leeuwenhoekiella]MAW96677.1 glycosyl transferase family 2 [Leeuwenhoekiella sp.]MBA81566.1 glycosyl transferase family 2 [Leeuwenhoekiella sp.]|tara:strand:- start:86457 stop:87449 length:993 start_codon:yes stop_codon:yes gene_type:complete
MIVSLIVCTYQRAEALNRLLASVVTQDIYPDEILIIDGSRDNKTRESLSQQDIKNLRYFQVQDADRGLTRQRNFGIEKLNPEAEIVCFLDDDVVLEPGYFTAVLDAFDSDPDIVGVGGVAINENLWKPSERKTSTDKIYVLEGFERKESQRFYLRNKLGLQSPDLPGIMPAFSHGRTYGYPLTGKNYEVDLLIGMAMSFRREVIDAEKFSLYFDGYGLYEDADYSLRALNYGKNVLCTAARLEHHHDPAGRPDLYKYGKMVIRNGWYVWRVKYPSPNLKARFKWNATALVLTLIRYSNVLTASDKKGAFNEATGRVVGWWSLLFNKPKYR